MKKRLLSALLFTAALSLPAAAQTLPARPTPEGSGTRPAPRTSAAEIDDANNANNAAGNDAADVLYLDTLVKYAMIIISTVPILCIYPFVQKYFMKGVMMGSIKE